MNKYAELDDVVFSNGRGGIAEVVDASVFFLGLKKMAQGSPASPESPEELAVAQSAGQAPTAEQAESHYQAAAPDTTGHLEGEFAVPVEQVVMILAQIVSQNLKQHFNYIYYGETLRDLNRAGLVKLFAHQAKEEVEEAKYFLRRISVLAPGGVPVPPTPAPEPLDDAASILTRVIAGEQQAIVLFKTLHSMLGENPMKFTVEQIMQGAQEHLDKLWQFMPEMPAPTAADKVSAAQGLVKQSLAPQFTAAEYDDMRRVLSEMREKKLQSTEKGGVRGWLAGHSAKALEGDIKGLHDEQARWGVKQAVSHEWIKSMVRKAERSGSMFRPGREELKIPLRQGEVRPILWNRGNESAASHSAAQASQARRGMPNHLRGAAGKKREVAQDAIYAALDDADKYSALVIPAPGSEPVEAYVARERELQLAQAQAEKQELAARLGEAEGMVQQHQMQAESMTAESAQLQEQMGMVQQQADAAQQQAAQATEMAAQSQEQAAAEADAKMRLAMRIQQFRQQLADIVSADPVQEEGVGFGAQAGGGAPVTPGQQQAQQAEQQMAEEQALAQAPAKTKKEVSEAQRAQGEAQEQGAQAQAAVQGKTAGISDLWQRPINQAAQEGGEIWGRNAARGLKNEAIVLAKNPKALAVGGGLLALGGGAKALGMKRQHDRDLKQDEILRRLRAEKKS